MSSGDGLSRFVDAIARSGMSIYDPVEIGDPQLWIPTRELESLLNDGLRGISLAGFPLRTRSKVVKEQVCRVLGYPIPLSFRKTRPRFPGQRFDTYVQKTNNLQVWNEELAPTRRYVIIRVSERSVITVVRVVTGDILARLDRTGTLTQKYQARLVVGDTKMELVTPEDTSLLRHVLSGSAAIRSNAGPLDYPVVGELLSIDIVFERLRKLVGVRFIDRGFDQERNRAAELHKSVCESLGYASFSDDGRFPDVRHQLLEVKLQTSPTIDLGLVRPDSQDALDVPKIAGQQVRHCDVRYALFYAETDGKYVTLTHFFLITGEAFFRRFRQFEGKVLNRKLQIPLPNDFFT
jgi:hypothetical protein